METAISKIEQTTQMVQEVSSASAEQTTGINQVKEAIDQFNDISQQNASSSEELASKMRKSYPARPIS